MVAHGSVATKLRVQILRVYKDSVEQIAIGRDGLAGLRAVVETVPHEREGCTTRRGERRIDELAVGGVGIAHGKRPLTAW